MLINVAESEECRVAVVEGGCLEELYIERAGVDRRVGNIYRGKVVNVESGIQAAFVDFGAQRNGFLHISDLHPRYYHSKQKQIAESVGKRKALRDRKPIQDCLHKGQQIVVQVTKEGMNTKGPTLSTYLALPGKYLVMMPWMKNHGISHKIEDELERRRLRQVLEDSKPPKNHGFIIRTAGRGCSKRDIQNDLRYLKRLWKSVEIRIEKADTPSEIYQESDLVIRTLRDVFNSRIKTIVCDSEGIARRIKDFLAIATPRLKPKVVCYDGKIPLFHKYCIEDEIAKVQSRVVQLKSGGSIVIEQTEALVSVDVNSGKFRRETSAERTAYETNMQAAVEIARQLRLRDLGGLIVCDFIDMRNPRHRRDVERAFRDAAKTDRARSRILKISMFGVVEMTRQRMRPSLQSTTYLACPNCAGTGYVKSHESLAIEIIRLLNLSAAKEQVKRVELFVAPKLADYLQNEKRTSINQLERFNNIRIIIHSRPDYTGERHDIVCYNERSAEVGL